MISSRNNVIAFVGEGVEHRDPGERLDEEVYRAIPALTHFASAAMEVSNKLSLHARNALFFEKGSDPELRALKVENALVMRHAMDSVQPDVEWMRSADPTSRKDFQSADNDLWVGPAAPGQ